MIKKITIIFPVYNEQKRLEDCFKEISIFNKKTKKINKEYIFVDDGSNDETKNILKKKIINNYNFRLYSYNKNKGKGYAIKYGVSKAKFENILTIDIDMSVSLCQLLIWLKNYKLLKKSIYFGSRNLPESKIKYSLLRKYFGTFFRILIKLFLKIHIKDTQCGFKLYTNNCARKIFSNLTNYGFCHDLEIIFIAKKNNLNIKELPVKWVHKKNSKLNLLTDTFIMLIEIIKLKITYKI